MRERCNRPKAGNVYYAERWLIKRGERHNIEQAYVCLEWGIDMNRKRKLCICIKDGKTVDLEPIAGTGWMFWTVTPNAK